MSEPRRLLTELSLVVTVVLVGTAFASNALHLSAYWGPLAGPPKYDDVAYMLAGFDLFEASPNSSIGTLVAALFHQHAPFQSALAFGGYRLFGVSQWAAYQVNGILLIALTLSVLWLTRSLGVISRLSLLLIVLATPFTTNLVTEFRPDLYWGLLCGFSVLLLLHPHLLDAPGRVRHGAVILGVAALHAKPSASPATALLLIVALALGIWLRTIYRPLSLRTVAIRAAVPLGVALLISAPYFALNARRIYDYIQVAFVMWRDVNQYKGSLVEHATYYLIGDCYRTALFLSLWIGMAAFLVNAALLQTRRLNEALAYHLALVGMVVLAYLIPTLSGMKSYFLGGIFYGTFLVATITTISAIVHSLEDHPDSPRHLMRWALPLVAGLVLLTAPAMPLVDVRDHRFAREVTAVYQQTMAAIIQDASQGQFEASSPKHAAPVVYIASPFIVNSHAISLLSRWEGAPIAGTEGYYTRSIPEHRAHLARSDYVILSEYHDSVYPGSVLSPDLLKIVRADPDFETISTFQHANGLRTLLFRHRRADFKLQN